MPFDGSGNFNVTDGSFTGRGIFTSEKNASQLVTAAHFDSFGNDIANGFQNCVTKDGQTGSITKLVLTATVDASTGVVNIGSLTGLGILGSTNDGSVFVGGGNFNIGTTAGCVCVGPFAGASMSTSQGNVYIGSGAAQFATSSGNDVIIGSSSANNVSYNAASNVFIGTGSCNNVTSGGGNVVVGSGSSGSLSTGFQNIVVGWNLDVPSGTASGQINIGATIFGTGCTNTGSGAGVGKIGINNNAPAYALDVATGDIGVTTAGKGLRVKEGANCKQGRATLVGGTVTVANTSVTAASEIFAFCQTPGGTPGFLRCSARVAGTSFTILSSSGTDTSVIAYQIFEPA